jgi:hypothetical protein
VAGEPTRDRPDDGVRDPVRVARLEAHVARFVDIIHDDEAAPAVQGDLRREESETTDGGDAAHDIEEGLEPVGRDVGLGELGVEVSPVVPTGSLTKP